MHKHLAKGISEKLPFWDEGDWRNKNRKPRTNEELKSILKEYGADNFQATGRSVLIVHIPRKEEHINQIRYVPHAQYVGKILDIGKYAFAKNGSLGATATYEDYVAYSLFGAKAKFTKNHKLLMIPDSSVLGVIENPDEWVKN